MTQHPRDAQSAPSSAPSPSTESSTPGGPSTLKKSRTWPAERCYFALLDTSGWPAAERVTEERLKYQFESELPEPLDAVHPVFVRVAQQRWLGCAVARSALVAEVPHGTTSLTPSHLPDHVREAVRAAGGTTDAGALELLVGEFEPTEVRAWRRRCRVGAVGAAAAVVALALFGIERRIDFANNQAEALRTERREVVRAALGQSGSLQALPAELALLAELRTMRLTRQQGDTVPPTNDATEPLAGLLRCWPSALPSRTDAIILSDAAIHVRGTVAESDAVQSLSSATAAIDGFKAAYPTVQAAPDGVRFGLEWRRDAPMSGRQP